MCRTLDLLSLVASRLVPDVKATGLVTGFPPTVMPDLAPPGTSVNLLAFIAASQSNGERRERALKGDMALRGVSNPAWDRAGDGGIAMLGNMEALGPAAGAESGGLMPEGISGIFVLMAAGLGDFMLASLPLGALCLRSQSQLASVTSDTAVEGALSSSFSGAYLDSLLSVVSVLA